MRNFESIKALVLQSSNENLSTIKGPLAAAHLEVVVADSARHALSILEADGSIHLILIDVLTPREGGFQLLKSVKENPRFQWYPVAMTSTQWDHLTVRQSLELGADAIFALPMAEDMFVAKVTRLLANGRRVVLVVDDEETIRKYMTTILESERFVVRTAASSDQALDIVKSSTVHGVISDIMMPGMSGLDLMVEIKKAHDHIPVILITGFSGKFAAEQAIAAGADAYFQKPFKNTELLATLRRVIHLNCSERTTALP